MKNIVNFNRPEGAENIETTGIRMSVILSTQCSGGNLTIIEQEVSVGASSPAHICNREDKVILVTDGKFMLFANGKKYEAAKGANIFIPRGTLHNFKNIGTQTGTLLVTLTPGGQENSLKEFSLSVKVLGNKPALLQGVAKKYDVVLA